MSWRLFRRYGFHRHLQASANDFSNVAHGHALFGHGVIPRACFQFFPRPACRDARHRGRAPPASGCVRRRHKRIRLSGVPRRSSISDEPLLDGIVNLGKAHHPHARRPLPRRKPPPAPKPRAESGGNYPAALLFCRRAARRTAMPAVPGGDESKAGRSRPVPRPRPRWRACRPRKLPGTSRNRG